MASLRTKKFWALYFGSILLLFFIMSMTALAYYRQESAARSNALFTVTGDGSTYDNDQLKNQSSLLTVGVAFNAFDPDKGLKAEMSFMPMKNVSNSQGEPTAPICVSFQDKELEFKTKELMPATTFAVTFLGDLSYYPFDVYTGQLIVHASTGTVEGCDGPLAINPSVKGYAQGFAVTARVFPGINEDDSVDFSSARIEFSARRTRVHQVFSTFMFMVMWALTLMYAYIAAWTWKGGKRVEFAIMSMSAALLYALPRVRDTQPGIPKMGIVQDLFGYCWNVFIIAVALISLMVNFIMRKDRKDKYRKDRDEDGSSLLQVMDQYLDDVEAPPPAYASEATIW